MMPPTRYALIALLVTALAGCGLPVPLVVDGGSSRTRQNVGEKVPAFIVPGVTTRADVLLKLGEPDGASENGRQLTYTRGVGVGGFAIIGIIGSGGSEKMAYDRLIIAFDDANVVTGARHERTRCSESFSNHLPTIPCVDMVGRDLLPLPASVEGAEVFRDAMWYRGRLTARCHKNPGPGTAGSLVIGKSSLLFYSSFADDRSTPLVTLPYTEITGIEIQRELWDKGCAVRVERAGGRYDSFTFIRGTPSTAVVIDAKSTENAGKLAQSHWRAATGK